MRIVWIALLVALAASLSPRCSQAQQVAIETTVDDLSIADQRVLRDLLVNSRHLAALALLGTQRTSRSDLKAHADQIAKDAQGWSNRISEILGAGTAAAAAQPVRPLLALEQSEAEDFDAAFLTDLARVDTALIARLDASADMELSKQVADLVEVLRPAVEAQATRRAELAED